MPDPVRELNDEAVRLHAAAELAAQQFRAAKAEAGRAVAIDEAADREALAAGQPLLERRAVAEAEEALGMAQRRHEAARQNARDAVTELARGISRDKAAWLIEQEGVGAAIQAACTSGTRRPVGPRSPKVGTTEGNVLRSTIPRALPYVLGELRRPVESPEAPTGAVKS